MKQAIYIGQSDKRFRRFGIYQYLKQDHLCSPLHAEKYLNTYYESMNYITVICGDDALILTMRMFEKYFMPIEGEVPRVVARPAPRK